ncbi:ATP-binding protein [Desulfovirgula thermocuniculi]|uniref:ATP-binding protein n=1 Tax=Desulfovirgula thermocuniculi TaxID=348842 RepID=UPI000489ABE2|nr:ATP-binding protein [Desulfovirgula thermocuniculi]
MYIGRVLLTKQEPAKPYEFWCWLRNDVPVDVEIGTLLVTEGSGGEKVLALVEDMESKSATENYLLDFYGSAYGNPDSDPPTKPTVIRLAKLRMLYRDPVTVSSPTERWRVRFATPGDVNLLAQRIPDKYRILAGFLKVGSREDNPQSWLPVFAHAQFLLGPEGAHINITGTSGLATKSSYALFLCYSVLAWAKNMGERVAVVLFNVKRRDFLRLHNIPPDWEEAKKWIEQWANDVGDLALAGRVKAMWEQARALGIDPVALNPPVRYFTYQGDPDVGFMPGAQFYSYGFEDLEREDFETALFTTYQPTEPQVILLNAYLEAKKGTTRTGVSFNQMLTDLGNTSRAGSSGNEVMVPGIPGTWASSVPPALRRRVWGFLNRASAVIERGNPRGSPIRFTALESGGLHVVQLNRLTDAEKRLVVSAVIRELSRGLEAPDRQVDRVIVVADELNKFAPASGTSPIKEQIIDVVARGRDLQLTLVGAQQFASEVDGEVYGNAATKVVGYSDESEVREPIYKYLGDLRELIPNLKKGQLILRHPLYPSPLIFWFPTPLHELIPSRCIAPSDSGQQGGVQ